MNIMFFNKNITVMRFSSVMALSLAVTACGEQENPDVLTEPIEAVVSESTNEPDKDLSKGLVVDAVKSTIGVKTGTFVDSEFYGEYQIDNKEFGTNVKVSLTDKERVMYTNSLPQWPADEFPEGNNDDVSEQDRTYRFALQPSYVGSATRERSTGVSIQGIKFDAGTAQRAKCENDVQYNVEAVQDLIPFGIDAHNAHVQNDGTYHYHNIPISEIKGDKLQHVGFALDGFLIYYSPKNEYPSSYKLRTEDREGLNCTYAEPDFPQITFDKTPDGTFQQDYDYVEGAGALDKCNGTIINGEYAYFVTDEYPHIPRCLNGKYESDKGEAKGKGRGGSKGGGHDFTSAAKKLGITEQQLRNAIGGPPPNFTEAAKKLGISEEIIQSAF